MAKVTKVKEGKYFADMKSALESFDVKKLLKWCKKYNYPLWKRYSQASEIVQIATMCKMICNRTDLLGTVAHKKAVAWLKDHNMKGQIF